MGWGSGMSKYKQTFSDSNILDANIFLISLVSVQLINGDLSFKEKRILWQIPSPTRYCRPIHIQLNRESTEINFPLESHNI